MDELIYRIRALNENELKILKHFIISVLDSNIEPTSCPKCHKQALITKAGKTRKGGAQLYLCHNCNKRFASTTNNPLRNFSHTSKDLIERFISLALDGETLDEMANKLNIAHSTAFAWKKKLYALIKQNQLIEKSKTQQIATK